MSTSRGVDTGRHTHDTSHGSGLCKLCGGTLPVGVTKCLFCGSLVDTAATMPHGEASDRTVQSGKHDVHGMTLVAVPAILAAFVAILVARTSPLMNPMLMLLAGCGCVLLASALLVWVEARRLVPAGDLGFPAGAWFGMTLALWPIGYPLYLHARAGQARRDFWRYGAAVAACFCLVCLALVGGHMVRRHDASVSARQTVGARGRESVTAPRAHFRNTVPVAPSD